ncbi:MAG: HAMP domain-containing sensor histidine kinase, partial [Myxococcota bacterium]
FQKSKRNLDVIQVLCLHSEGSYLHSILDLGRRFLSFFLAFVIARRFDKPEDIYYDPDDDLAQIAKQKALKHAQEAKAAQAKGVSAPGLTARLAAWCGATTRQARQAVINSIPTWGKVNQGTLLRLRLFVLPFGALGAGVLLLSFAYYFLWTFRQPPPDMTGGMSPLLTGLCIVTALMALVLVGCDNPDLPEQTRANWWFATVFVNLVTWTVAVMTHKGYWADMAIWVAAGMIPALSLDRAATVRLMTLGAVCGFGAYGFFDNTHMVTAVLGGVAVEWVLLVPLYFGIVSSLTSGRQAKLELAVKAMALRGAILAHDAKEPMIAAEDAGKMFAKFMPRLVEAHKEMALIEPERYQRLSKHKYEGLLAAGPRLVERARHGLDFFRGMVESLRDPQKRMGKPSAVSVHEAIEKAVHYELTSVQQERVHFRGGPDATIWVNEDEFAHAVGNFLKNAVRHTKLGDRVEAWTEADASSISVCVQDPGTGIARRQKLAIFNPFFTAGTPGGTGVGLGMVDLVAATLRAALRCLSVLGVGTKFILRIPKRSAEELARLQRQQQLEEEQEHQELLTRVQRLDDERAPQEQAQDSPEGT